MMTGKALLGAVGVGAVYFALPTVQERQTFSQSAPNAIARLQASDRLVEGTGMGSLTLAGAGMAGDGAVLVKVSAAGKPRAITCRVVVRPTGDAASVAEVDCNPPAGQDAAIRQVAVDAMEIVVREHVAAAIEGRPYDIDKVADRMLAFVVVSRPAIARSLSVDRSADGDAPSDSGLR